MLCWVGQATRDLTPRPLPHKEKEEHPLAHRERGEARRVKPEGKPHPPRPPGEGGRGGRSFNGSTRHSWEI